MNEEASMDQLFLDKIHEVIENNMAEELNNYSWEFNLVESEDVNAWCMPGGKVVVYTGILPLTRDENGLAVVMGHEIAHAIAEHGGERMSQMLLIEMGRRSTGGYSVTLGSHAAQVSDDTVVIHVVWNVPDTGAVLAQVVTSPYLLLKLAKGDYRRVVVVDQENEILFEIDVPEF